MTDGEPSNGKLDRWLARQKAKDSAAPRTPGAAEGVNGAPATAAGVTPPPSAGKPPLGGSPRSPAGARGSAGGVGACCNLIKLLDPDELVRVHEALVAVMREKRVVVPALPGDLVTAPGKGGPVGPLGDHQDFTRRPMVLTATAGESIALLTDVLEEVRKLGSEAAHREDKISSVSNPPAQSEPATGAAPGEGDGEAPPSAKMSRWLNKVAKNKEEAASANGPSGPSTNSAVAEPAEAGEGEAPPSGKASRWLKRLNKAKGGAATDSSEAAPASDPPLAVSSSSDVTAPAGETPVEFVRRACAAVRKSWARGGAMTLTEEWDKLNRERASIEALTAMVYAVKQTPERVTGSPTGSPRGAPANPGHADEHKAPVALQQMQRSVPNPALKKPDPDVLLAEFLAARREERVKETAQMIDDKKNPKKPDPGAGWRAGSPMASAAKPTVPVRISLSRPPPPPPPPIMIGPPPENLGEGGSREDVINKEGGGFFFYPPGHPNYVPGGPASANIQLEGQLRSTVHPQERIAPHWSRARFTAHGMPEVSCEARHATFGPLKEVQGRLVRCNPPLANKEITNEHQVRGNVVYIKRGGCSFTKKARMAQKAGAVGMVVANSDRETFGMSYTDDGEPFDTISIPCVMISSDICSKLEACKQSPDGRAPWTCALQPLVERQANVVFQETMQAAFKGAEDAVNAGTASPPMGGERDFGAQSKDEGGFMKRLKKMLP
jgi:hypothetical protein